MLEINPVTPTIGAEIRGLDLCKPCDSATLAALADLYRQAAIPEYQCRLRWEPGTMALWDNRCEQHYAVSDYWPATRVMERVTICGDRPR